MDIGAREEGHVYMGMTALAGIIGADPAAGAWGYHLHDHLGSTRRIHNQAKDRTARFDFTPYGEIFHAENPGAAAPRFTGKTLDAESGLYHFPYRYYNPQNARWLTRDPLGMVDGPNVYAYVSAKPLTKADSLGLTAYICMRSGAFGSPAFNHAYFWDDRSDASVKACGTQGSTNSNNGSSDPTNGEDGPSVDKCVPIHNSEGKEDNIMICCEKFANRGIYVPGVADCHSLINKCIKKNGVHHPGMPAGRINWGPLLGYFLPTIPVVLF